MYWIEREIEISIIDTFITNVYMTFYEFRIIAWGSAPWIEILCQIKVYVTLKDRKRSLSEKNDHNALWH